MRQRKYFFNRLIKMWTLAFDTTTSYCSVALFEDKTAKSVFSQSLMFGQSELLIVKIKELLEENRLSVKDLDLIGVCTGPGSFTGVRSSIAAARTFALAQNKIAVTGINAFDAYVSLIEPKQRAERTAVIVETKRDDFYVAYYDINLQKIESGKTAFYDEIIADLRGFSTTFIGDGVERFLSKPSGLHLHDAVFENCPPIKDIALLAIKRFEDKNLDFPKPFYLKAADICVK